MSGTLRLVAKTKTPQLLMQTADAPALFPHGRRKAKKRGRNLAYRRL